MPIGRSSARDGRLISPGPLDPERTLADRRPATRATTHTAAAAASTSVWAAIPSATAIATPAAPRSPPTDQPAWSDEVIGRPRDRSRATPCAFIETSIAPFIAPNTNSAIASSGTLRRQDR